MTFIITFIIEIILLVVLYKKCSDFYSGFEELDEKEFRLKKLLPIGIFILQDILKYQFDKPKDAVKQGKLAQIYGAKQAATYLRLNAAHQICILLVGIVLITFLAGVSSISAELQDDSSKNIIKIEKSQLERPKYGDGNKNIPVTAIYINGDKEEKVEYVIPVGEQIPNDQGCVDIVEEKLEKTILNKNASLDQVTGDLNLISKSSALKVNISWETSDSNTIDREGDVFPPKNGEGNKSVKLTARIAKGKIEKEKVYKITVLQAAPLTDKESIQEAKSMVEQQLKEINQNQTSQKIQLPSNIESTKINWKLVRSNNANVVEIFIFGFIVLAAVVFLNNKVLDDKIKQRRQTIQIDYPEFLNKLIILLTSGMAMPKALEKIALDYMAISQRKGIKKPFYEELSLMVGEMTGGKIFSEALNDFALRCKAREILKFISIVELNHKKGSGELITTLKLQSNEAWETRKNVAKRLGEEAGTKLLFPMMIMLMAILMIVMTPAILSISGM